MEELSLEEAGTVRHRTVTWTDPLVGAAATSLVFAAAVVLVWLAVAAILRQYHLRIIA